MKNKKYTATKKNSGNIPELPDERVKYVAVGCGFCIECRKKKANEWRVRILEEIKSDSNCLFVNLSLSNESIEKIENELKVKKQINDANAVATYALRHFLENIRSKKSTSIKHWFITELGQNNTQRVHLHGIMWTKDKKLIQQKWIYGIIHIGQYCNAKTANYMIKYVTKTDPEHKEFIPKILSSKGIGKNYLLSYSAKQNKFNDLNTKEYYRLNNGFKTSLPMYYRNKLYNEDEREILWLNILDKQKRYVMGEEIDISTDKGLEKYEKARQWHSLRDERNGNLQSKYKLKKERKKYNAMLKKIKEITNLKKRINDSFNKNLTEC